MIIAIGKKLKFSSILCFTSYFDSLCELFSVWYPTIMTMFPLLVLCRRAAWRTVPLPGASLLCRPVLLTYCTFSPSLHYADPLILSLWANAPAAICHKQMFHRTMTSKCGCWGMGAWRKFWLETCSAERAWSRWVILAPLRSWGQLISHGNQEGNRTSERSLSGAVQALT